MKGASEAELKGVEVCRPLKPREGPWAERNARGRDPNVLKESRAPRERGRTGTGVRNRTERA